MSRPQPIAAVFQRSIILALIPLSMTMSAVVAQTPAAGVNQPTAQASGLAPRDLSKVKAEFVRVRDRMESVQRDFDKAARSNQPAVRDEALKDWRRSLDGLEPYVKELSANVSDEKPLIEQYQKWEELYNQAADPALAGEFFLQTSKYWSEVTAGTEGWEQEQSTGTFDSILNAKADDAGASTLGMPKTVAFVTAVNTYIANVIARPDYLRFKSAPNVKQDLEQVMAARGRAQAKLAMAAKTILDSAGRTDLNNTSRDHLERFVENDLSVALAGFEGQGELQNLGRTTIYNYDKNSFGEATANEKSIARLTAAAERNWPAIVAVYATKPMAPVGATRGQIVRISNAKNLIGKDFAVDTYDFADYVGGAPVIGNFAPGVRTYLKNVYEQTGMSKLPDDATYDLVVILRGTAQVPNVKRPGATTAPATATDAAATTTPATTDCTLIEIVALKAGPAAVGVPVDITAER